MTITPNNNDKSLWRVTILFSWVSMTASEFNGHLMVKHINKTHIN